MRIQHNIMAMNAYRNYNKNTSALSKNLERLSSGYKINRAGDDAAGLAISEKMRAQITGLNAAQKNVKDGISLVNTAEGAMQEIQDMLNRMVYLATQSANGTYDNEVDRSNLQKEVQSLKSEINRIADSANFNGIKLLDGSLDTREFTTSSITTSADAILGDQLILDETGGPDEVGDKTVLKRPQSTMKGTEFTVNLQNMKVQNAKAGDTMDVTIGGTKITLKAQANADGSAVTEGFDDSGVYVTDIETFGDTEKLAAAIADAFNSLEKTNLDQTETGLHIEGEEFKAEVVDGTNITFTQQQDENGEYKKTIDPNLKVDINYTAKSAGTTTQMLSARAGEAGGTSTTSAAATSKPAEVTGDAVTASKIGWVDATESASTAGSITNAATDGFAFDTAKLTAYVNKTQANLGDLTTAAEVNFKKISGTSTGIDGKLGLYVGSNLVGVAVDDTGAGKAFGATAGDGAAVTYKFAAVDSNAPVADTDLGTLTLKDDGNNAIAANTFDNAVNVGKTLGQTVDTSSLKTVDASGLDKDKILAAAKAAGIESGEITLSENAENKLELKVGEKIIGVATAALDNSATSFTINGADGTALGTVETSAAVAASGFTGTVKTGLTYAAESYTTPSSMTNNTSETTGVNAAEAVKAVYSFAVTETTALAVGDTITIGSGDSAKTFTVISDGFGDPAEGQVKVSDVTGAAKLAKFIANNTTDENYDVSADGTTGVLTYTANKGGVVSTSGSGPDAAPTAVTVAVAKGASGATTPDISIAASPTVVTAGAEATEATITADTTTLDADAIKTVVDGIDGVSDGKVTVEMNATSKKLELKVGNTVIGTSDEAVDGVKSEFTFKGSDADTTALGTIKFSSAPTEAAGVNFKSGLSYTASVTSNEPPADDPNAEETATVPSGPISVEGVDLTQKTNTIAEADLKKIEKAFSEIGSNGKIVLNGDVEIDLSKVTEGLTADSSKYQDLLNNILNAAKTAVTDWNDKNSATTGYKYENVRISDDADGANILAKAAAPAGSIYIVADQTKVDSPETEGKVIGSYNVSTTQNLLGAGKDANVLASTIITADKFGEVVKDGTTLTIGKDKYVFKDGADSVVKDAGNGKDANGAKIIDVTGANDKTLKAMEILGQKGFAENDLFDIGFDANEKTLSIHEREGRLDDPSTDEDKKFAKDLESLKGFQGMIKAEGYEITTETTTKVNDKASDLQLQIGDTSNSFNTLKVGIGDMHVSGMKAWKRDAETGEVLRDNNDQILYDDENTLDKIDISTQDGAQKAINVIKDAINYVSSVRGDLGAISNRLDHTANNLSVMAENITDAESSIRDTDIAEEMMAYTKNNILVQSAQAMLAQANQVPQGVLQLLQ